MNKSILNFKSYAPVLSLGVLSLLFIFSNSANAGQCLTPPEVGTWLNHDTNTGGVTKVVIDMDCVDDTQSSCSGGICTIVHGVKPIYTVKVWGKCHPTDCYWGKVEGVYTSADWMRFFYDKSWVFRTVWGQTWPGDRNWLRVIVDSDYADSRPDHRFDGWFRKQ